MCCAPGRYAATFISQVDGDKRHTVESQGGGGGGVNHMACARLGIIAAAQYSSVPPVRAGPGHRTGHVGAKRVAPVQDHPYSPKACIAVKQCVIITENANQQ